jgi:ABC-2 type transport system ATP-binding protein
MPNGNMIQVENLVKIYSGDVRAVSDISFAVVEGEFFGFLGPNGAGKSTTMKILSTLLKKTSGHVMVAGHDVDRNPTDVRRSIGFAMQEVGLDDLATGRDFLTMQGLLYGLPRKEARRRAEELLELVGLTSVAKRKVGTYSGGMRRRIDLVSALVHRPPLLFLDEPTTGLDPQSRIAIWEHLSQLNSQGITIFLTTQMMEEADRLCQRIAIIDRGQLVAEGSPRALKEGLGGDVVTVTLSADDYADKAGKAEALVKERSYVSAVSRVDHSLNITVRDGGAAAPDLLRLLLDNRISVANLAVASPTLDDVFLKHTGRKIRTEDTGRDEMGDALRPYLGLKQRR